MNELKESDIGKKMEMAEKLAKKEKEQIISLLEDWISQERSLMRKNGEPAALDNIDLLLTVKKDLEGTNVNMRLALEYIFFNLKN